MMGCGLSRCYAACVAAQTAHQLTWAGSLMFAISAANLLKASKVANQTLMRILKCPMHEHSVLLW